MGIVRFLLFGILVYVILRFATRFVAALRAFMASGAAGQGPESRDGSRRRDVPRDIKDATFEDVTGGNGKKPPEP